MHRLGSQHLNSHSVVEFMNQQALHTRQNLHARPPRLHPDVKPHPSEKRGNKKKTVLKMEEGAGEGDARPKLQDGVIVAQYMYMRGGGHGHNAAEPGLTELMTEYLDAKALETLMFERTKEHDGVIQQFVEPPGDSNSTIRARWSVSATTIEQSTSCVPLTSLQLAIPQRAATFDAKAADSIIEPVRSSHVKNCINALVSSIVAAVRNTLPNAWSLFGLDLFFKMSASDGAILFLFCANARVVHQTVVQPNISRPLTSANATPPPTLLRLMTAGETTHSHRQLLDGFFDCPRCKRTFNTRKELSFKVSFRHIILAQMLRAPQNKPASSRAGSPPRRGEDATNKQRKQHQSEHDDDDDDDDENDFVSRAASMKRVGGRARPSSAGRGGANGGARPDSATLELRQLGVMWHKEDLLTMQPWALDESVKEVQRRLKLKSLEQINSVLSTTRPSLLKPKSTLETLAKSSGSKNSTAPFLPTWELQQLPQERLTAFQREVISL